MIPKLTVLALTLLVVSGALVAQTGIAPEQRFLAHGLRLAQGSPVEGRADFAKLRCNSCHSVYGEEPRAQIPLRDLSHETPQTVANLIIARSDLAPEAYFDEMAMSAAASPMTLKQLANVVAYLRHPEAARR